jgi:TctA family transporter
MLLGPIIEDNFRRMVEIEGTALPMLTRPISVFFLLLAVAFLVFSIRRHRAHGSAESADPKQTQ